MFPHGCEIIAMVFALKGQNAAFRNAGKIMDSEQILHNLVCIFQPVTPPLYGGFAKGTSYFCQGLPPVIE